MGVTAASSVWTLGRGRQPDDSHVAGRIESGDPHRQEHAQRFARCTGTRSVSTRVLSITSRDPLPMAQTSAISPRVSDRAPATISGPAIADMATRRFIATLGRLTHWASPALGA